MTEEKRMTISLRPKEELYKWLKALADKNRRSLGGQIEWMLQQLRDEEGAKGRKK